MAVDIEEKNRVDDFETLELKVAQLRDELRLKMHLARADARDVYDGLERKWQRFRNRLGDLREASGGAAEDVWTGVRSLGHELAEGYEKLRKSL
jgi:hypothetical protein